MSSRLLLSCLLFMLISATGCRLLPKKNAEPKESGNISAEVEENLKRRWVDRRSAELVAQGKSAEAARTQATQEFREKFEYLGAAKK